MQELFFKISDTTFFVWASKESFFVSLNFFKNGISSHIANSLSLKSFRDSTVSESSRSVFSSFFSLIIFCSRISFTSSNCFNLVSNLDFCSSKL